MPRPGAAFGAVCITTAPHRLSPRAPDSGTVALWAASNPPTASPNPGARSGQGGSTPLCSQQRRNPGQVQGWLTVAAFRAGRVGLESSLAPRNGGPQQPFLRTAWTFQRRAADTEGPGGTWGLKQVSGALPDETDFMCKPELPAPVEGSSRPTARMCSGTGPCTGAGGQLPAPSPCCTAAWRLRGCAPVSMDGEGGGLTRSPKSWNL